MTHFTDQVKLSGNVWATSALCGSKLPPLLAVLTLEIVWALGGLK
ncbi:hypothetical protein [Deinococcus kurensis]|nr:hypothetical protein [Deinococcus kurensis]